MIVTFSFRYLLPAAFLTLAITPANAAPISCSSLSGSSLSAIATNGSCSIGDLVFSDFAFQFTPTADSPATPNPSTDVTVVFNELTDSVTPDPFGTVGTPTKPLYQVIVDFTGGNIVGENQSERYVLQYLVTNSNSGTQVVQVDNNIAGGAVVSAGASGGLTAKSMCDGAPFGSNGGTPTGTCTGNVYTSVAPNGGSMFIDNPDNEVDSSILYNSVGQKFGGLIGSSNFGVYDQADISGGNTSPSGTATVTQIENDFLEAPVSTPTVPEPGGLWACAMAVAVWAGRSLIRAR